MCHSGEYFQSFGCHSLDLPELTSIDFYHGTASFSSYITPSVVVMRSMGERVHQSVDLPKLTTLYCHSNMSFYYAQYITLESASLCAA